jgi:hypothetical protein
MENKIYLNPDVVFYHIEKCAGSSLENMLYEYLKNIYADNDIYIPFKNNFRHYNLQEKQFFEKNKFKVILSHISFNDEISIFSEHLSITCVRHPINRMISHYYYFDHDEYGIPLNRFSKDELIKYIHTKKAILLRISGGSLNIDDAINNLNKMNIILILEKLQDDVLKLNKLLNQHYNVNYKLILQNENISNKKVSNDDFKKDYEMLKTLNVLEDELTIYNHILAMNDIDRFNLSKK